MGPSKNFSLIDCVGKSAKGKDLIQRVSTLFVKTLELFLDYPRANAVDGVIQQAERYTKSYYLFCHFSDSFKVR